MKAIKVILNAQGQTDPETIQSIYRLIPNPAFRTANTLSRTFRHALKCMRDWKCQIYECETLGGLLIFAQDRKLLDGYQVQRRGAELENTNL